MQKVHTVHGGGETETTPAPGEKSSLRGNLNLPIIKLGKASERKWIKASGYFSLSSHFCYLKGEY